MNKRLVSPPTFTRGTKMAARRCDRRSKSASSTTPALRAASRALGLAFRPMPAAVVSRVNRRAIASRKGRVNAGNCGERIVSSQQQRARSRRRHGQYTKKKKRKKTRTQNEKKQKKQKSKRQKDRKNVRSGIFFHDRHSAVSLSIQWKRRDETSRRRRGGRLLNSNETTKRPGRKLSVLKS